MTASGRPPHGPGHRPEDRLAGGCSRALQKQWWRAQPGWQAQALRPLAGLLAGLAALHRAAYASGWLQRYHAHVPVLVVGNLIVGGAGKTPTVLALIDALRRRGWQPGVVSRGYGRQGTALVDVDGATDARRCGDEPLLIHLRTGVPVVVAADRAAAAAHLLRAYPAVDLLLADDGLQHWRLQRDVQVLVFDARGAGNGLRLPAGPLRQALPRALPQDTLVLYNADQPSTRLPGWQAQRKLAGATELAPWWRGEQPSPQALLALRGRPVLAAAGTGQPERFFGMLRAAGLVIEPYPLPDHTDFATLPWPPDTPDVVVTEKDAVKIRPDRIGSTRVWVVGLDFQLPHDFEVRVVSLLEAARAPAS